jgi:hypothetical protein
MQWLLCLLFCMVCKAVYSSMLHCCCCCILQVPVGTRVRLMMRDDGYNQQQQLTEFAALSKRLPAADSSLGVLNYSCVALPADEEQDAAAKFLPYVSDTPACGCIG